MSLSRVGPVVLLAVVVAGCPNQRELCESGVDQVCERVFECQPSEVQASPQFQAAFGTSVANCKELLYANPLRPAGAQGIACAEVDSNQELCTNLGEADSSDFDLNNASQCRDEREALSCQAYLGQLQDPAQAPAVCADRCN